MKGGGACKCWLLPSLFSGNQKKKNCIILGGGGVSYAQKSTLNLELIFILLFFPRVLPTTPSSSWQAYFRLLTFVLEHSSTKKAPPSTMHTNESSHNPSPTSRGVHRSERQIHLLREVHLWPGPWLVPETVSQLSTLT